MHARKIAAGMLATTLVVGTLAISTEAATYTNLKKATVKKVLEVQKGASTKIKVTKIPSKTKLTYKVANRKIVSVNKKGKVTGITEGKTSITITLIYKKKKLTKKCSIQVVNATNTAAPETSKLPTTNQPTATPVSSDTPQTTRPAATGTGTNAPTTAPTGYVSTSKAFAYDSNMEALTVQTLSITGEKKVYQIPMSELRAYKNGTQNSLAYSVMVYPTQVSTTFVNQSENVTNLKEELLAGRLSFTMGEVDMQITITNYAEKTGTITATANVTNLQQVELQ